MKICSHCGGQVEKDDAKFCNLCGEKIEQEQINKFCNKCGNEITDSNAKFCVSCGETFAPKVKKRQRNGCVIGSLILVFLNLISIIGNIKDMPDIYVNANHLWASVTVFGIPALLGVLLSIIGARKCHGAFKVIGIVSMVINCVVLVCLLVMFLSASSTAQCATKQSTDSYEYYYDYDYYY